MLKLILIILATVFILGFLFITGFFISGLYTAIKLRKKINNQTWKEIEDAIEPNNGHDYLNEVTTLLDKHRKTIKDIHRSLYGDDWYCVNPISPKQMDVYMYYDIKEKIDWIL